MQVEGSQSTTTTATTVQGMAGSPPAPPGSFLPGIDLDLEPLEPFYDDVFAGMDEHPAGPWAHQHHMLQGAPLSAETHFPAIDCNLLDDQEAAAHAPVVHDQQPAAPDGVQASAGSAHSSCQHAPGAHPDEPHCSNEHQRQQEQQGEAGAVLQEQHVAATAAPAAADADQATADGEASQQPSSSTGAASAAAFPAVVSSAADPPSHASISSGEDAGLAAEGAAAADAGASRPARAAAADSPEPSSASLPDIDDVPEVQEEDVAQEQQQDAPGQAAQTAQEQLLLQQQQHCDADDDASLQLEGPRAAALQPAGGNPAQQPADSHSCPAASTDAACPADAPDSDSQEQQEAVELVSAEAAAVGDCSAAAFLGHEAQQSAHADDFASPCSSWHSCVTAASKASSMNSSRGFFLQPPAAAATGSAGIAAVSAAAALVAASDTEKGASQGPKHPQQQQQQQVAPSKSGVSSPAMVSSLHLALQAQQQHSQHSDQLAASAALEDPLNAAGPATATASVSSLAAGIAELAGGTAAAEGRKGADSADSASNSSSGEEGEDGRSSQQIAVQCAHEHYQRQQQHRREDDPWQSVSPPSFSSSPGLLVSAAAARAVAAAGAAAQGEQGATGADAHSDADAGAHAVQEGVSGEQQQEAGDTVEADDDMGHGCFYADAAGLSMSPEEGGLLYHPGLQQHPHQHMAASSYMLRQSELVDLSLSTSMHPSQLQHMQQAVQHPCWLTAHQQLPPAAAQAVERAVVALNDSYCYPGRTSPSEVLGSAAASAPGSAGGARAMGVAAMGAVGGAIRRSGAGVQWNRAHTQPQQDQQARHRLPSQASPSGAAGPFGWPGTTVLGDWFSSTLQQPLAAVAVGVGQKLGMAHGQHQQGQQGGAVARQHSGSRQHAQPSGASSSSGPTRAAGGAVASAGVAPVGAGTDAVDTAAAGATAASAREAHAEDSLEDEAVLVEKTSDLPQSLQEQEDEAFRGLLFLGGRDSQGRPVVIINTDAIPAGHNSAPRDAALAYLLKRLSPVVTRVSGARGACWQQGLSTADQQAWERLEKDAS